MPLLFTVTCSPAMSTFCSTVEPVSEPVVPFELAVAVEVTLPMVMKPSRMEMPLSVALAAICVIAGAFCVFIGVTGRISLEHSHTGQVAKQIRGIVAH